jgi:mono/diheme cytochrome c family protein
MKLRYLIGSVLLVLLLVCGCRKKAPVREDPADSAGELFRSDSGLSDAERQEFYHLTMGSELMPLAWLKALESASTGKPFLQEVDRFGLLVDEKNPDGLPIGLTAAPSKDSRFVGKMVGLNCAACHVGEVHYQAKRLRIDGAPSLFDPDAFTQDLIASVKATVQSPAKLVAFLARVIENTEDGNAAKRPLAYGLLRAFGSLDALRNAGELERGLASHLEALLNEETRQRPAALGRGLPLAGGNVRDLIGAIRHGELRKILAGRPGASSPLAKLATAGERESAVKEWIEHAIGTVRVLKARVEFAKKVIAESKRGLPATRGGPGRVDDFGLARNLLFEPGDAGALTAPCSIPHLWGLKHVTWTDWDANTTSSLGRSMATALAGGAVFDPETFKSTVPPRNLARLDELSIKIRPPAWPEAVLGKIDRDKTRQGAALFAAHCAKCHDPAQTPRDSLFDQTEVGTDPTRLRNYARKLGERAFPAALRDTVAKYLEQACKDNHITEPEARKLADGRPNQWRATNGYVARPLLGVWATAPYLHNGSVPTLYDLLLPAKQRPRSFHLGHRDFDPVKVGYRITVESPRFTFDTAHLGNTNTGHEYGTTLSDAQRQALIEYLKTT